MEDIQFGQQRNRQLQTTKTAAVRKPYHYWFNM